MIWIVCNDATFSLLFHPLLSHLLSPSSSLITILTLLLYHTPTRPPPLIPLLILLSDPPLLSHPYPPSSLTIVLSHTPSNLSDGTGGVLQLPESNISDEEIHALAALLRNNMTIEELNLRGNVITDDGARALGESVSYVNTCHLVSVFHLSLLSLLISFYSFV